MESVELGEDVAEGPARVGVERLGAPQLHARERPGCHSAVGGLERLQGAGPAAGRRRRAGQECRWRREARASLLLARVRGSRELRKRGQA